MRIFFASHSAELAGAEQSLLRLVRAAARRGHTGVVSIPKNGPLRPLLAESRGFDVSILPSHLWMGRRTHGLVGAVRILQCGIDTIGFIRRIRRTGVDVVVVNSSVTPAPLLAAAVCRVRSVLVVRETMMTNPMLRSFLPKKTIRWILSQLSSDVVCVSKFVADQYGYRSTVIYPQIDPVFFDEPKTQPPGSFDNTSSDLNGVMLGYFTPEKGQLDAIAAVNTLNKAGVAINLDIYGSGPSSFQNKIAETIRLYDLADQVRVHAPTTDPKSVLEKADFSIVCSRNEAFGKVTAESILAETPVIGYGVGGTAEIIATGGGLSVLPSTDSLAEGLHRIATDPEFLNQIRIECAESPLRKLMMNTADDLIENIEKQIL